MGADDILAAEVREDKERECRNGTGEDLVPPIIAKYVCGYATRKDSGR